MTPWRPADLPDLTGKTALVTGANSGIGFHAVLGLAEHGAHVLLAARNPERGEKAIASVRERLPQAKVELVRLDLADLADVEETAKAVLAAHEHIDLLINNAGEKMVPKRRETKDGFEAQFGTNHLGHFALTGLLLPALRPGSRIVNITSLAHKFFAFAIDDPQQQRRYLAGKAYGNSKLANMIFTLELDRRLVGRDITAVAAHPGFALDPGESLGNPVFDLLAKPIIQDMAGGAMPTLYAATVPNLPGGSLIGPGNLTRTKGAPRPEKPSSKATDPALGRRLWGLSEDLTGVRYLSS
ncbi:oxidoreductase [Kutzneria buriramensis]|uniref:NAD(P)-dependent dehydrogenase (Short-subunit alcohol dehydrogenase family) n=1 Tax=Kutzneria buriramensis TaxID=1045776 RepID=A0A3E0H0J0_9PSEU|nr:oxidoreductase [Kutzneria buriramensis]REH36165.1 NAD(P)-dependent dehydrogenase (short-subunit alcohol dehydrogenase family) [Kutzneria buriramensis]